MIKANVDTRSDPKYDPLVKNIRVNRRFSPTCQSRDMVRSLIAAHYSTL